MELLKERKHLAVLPDVALSSTKVVFSVIAHQGWIAQWALQMEAVLISCFSANSINFFPACMCSAAAEHDADMQQYTEA